MVVGHSSISVISSCFNTTVFSSSYILNTGEIKYLITNIENLSYGDIVEIYKKRWEIETMYYSLKSKLQIEKFTSSNKTIIEQDLY